MREKFSHPMAARSAVTLKPSGKLGGGFETDALEVWVANYADMTQAEIDDLVTSAGHWARTRGLKGGVVFKAE